MRIWRAVRIPAVMLVLLAGAFLGTIQNARACGGCGGGTCAAGLGCGCGCGAVGGLGDGVRASAATTYRSNNMQLESRLSLQQLGGASDDIGSAIWGWHDDLTNREYALMGLSNGTSFVDVTDPTSPVFLGQMATETGRTVWRELQVYQNTLYVVSDANGAHGMQVFDLTRLRDLTTPTTPYTFTPNTVYNGVTNVHTISINQTSGYAYLNGSNLGQHVVSLQGNNRLNPIGVASYTQDNYIHDSMILSYNGPDTRYTGHEIAFNSSGASFQGIGGLTISDVTDKANPVRLSNTQYPNLGYTHQGRFTEDGRFFISNDEFDELNNQSDPNMRTKTHIWDLQDLEHPDYLGAWEHDSRVIDHNLFIKGNLLFESNYTDGLRVFQIGDLAALAAGPRNADGTVQNIQAALTSFAFFDSYPGDDLNPETSFNGQWGNYPFLPSGTILAADRQNGLFVLTLNAESAAPEPASLFLLAPGMVLIASRRRFRRVNRN